jgi:hypothetical protein
VVGYIIEMMRYILVLAVLCSAALAQTAAPQPAPKSVAKPPSRNAQPRPDDGSVASGVYSESFFNLSYNLAPSWVVKTPEMRQGLAGQDNSILLLSAFEKDKPAPGHIAPSITITAETLSAYPEVKTAADYFAALSEIVTNKGFAVLNEPAEIEIGGVTFLRGDFQEQEGGGSTMYQASMVAIRKGYILGITAITGNEEELTPMLNRLHIFAPPSLKKP